MLPQSVGGSKLGVQIGEKGAPSYSCAHHRKHMRPHVSPSSGNQTYQLYEDTLAVF